MPKRAARPSSDRILVAAENLFATQGYNEVSLRQLIAAAGVSTTAFYARFESKAAVLDTLTASLFAELREEAARVLPQTRGLADGIERGIDLLCGQLGSRKPLVRLVIAEAGAVGPTLAIRQKSYAMMVAFLAHALKALLARGRIPACDADATAWALVGALEMQVVRWAVWDELDVDGLRRELLAVARAVLPKELS